MATAAPDDVEDAAARSFQPRCGRLQSGMRAVARVYGQAFPQSPGDKRYICLSLWRTFSPGAQDWPLAVYAGRTVNDAETVSNTLLVVDVFPLGDALTAPVDGEDQMIAATMFRYRPQHRCPHTAFQDTSFPVAKVRETIEVWGVAYSE